MTRKAILIAASPQSSPVPGVYTDVDWWDVFLRSNPGGVWSTSEIYIAKDYKKDAILKLITSAKSCDYSLVVFAGHGQTLKTDMPWAEAQLLLSEGNSLSEREINPGSPRCTLIMDCCRGLADEEEPTELIKEAAELERANDPDACCALFTKTLAAAESGLVKIYSRAVGSATADTRSFTKHLLFGAAKWAGLSQGVLTLNEAVGRTAQGMTTSNPQQKPEYHGGRRLRHFPLAVSPQSQRL